MIGLMYLLALLLYLALSIAVVVWVGRWAARSSKRRWAWMTGAGVVMYLVVFWDLVPTIVMHRYLCSTYAGVTVYKTPEVWLAENRDGPKDPLMDVKSLFPGPHDTGNAPPDGRFAMGSRRNWLAPLPIVTGRMMAIDRVNGDVLVELRTVDAGSPQPGSFGGWRRYFFWLQQPACWRGDREFNSTFNALEAAYKGIK